MRQTEWTEAPGVIEGQTLVTFATSLMQRKHSAILNGAAASQTPSSGAVEGPLQLCSARGPAESSFNTSAFVDSP